MELPEEEIDIHCEQDEELYWIARIFHKTSSTIKISNRHLLRDEAIDEARKGLIELLIERKQGLGQK